MVEITYTGEPEQTPSYASERYKYENEDALTCIKRYWLPQLQWMKSLDKLVLVKLGPFRLVKNGKRIYSRILDALICDFLFPLLEENVKPTLRPHKCIWFEDFEVFDCFEALDYADPECLQSYRTGGSYKYEFKSFHNLVQLDGMVGVHLRDSLLPDLKKLTYFTISSYDDEEVKMHQ